MIIPLFPLRTVLFPGGRLPLRIFEARYMDMAADCLRQSTAFGVCLIARGDEVARAGQGAAEPQRVGTLAQIAECDMQQLGVLSAVVQGGERFRLLRHWPEASGLLRGEVEAMAAPPVCPVPTAYAPLVSLLRAIIDEMGTGAPNAPAAPHRFADADWVGMRYAEVLPIALAARQKLLELEDDIDRLEIIYRFLEGKGLLPDG